MIVAVKLTAYKPAFYFCFPLDDTQDRFYRKDTYHKGEI